VIKRPDNHKWRCCNCEEEFVGGELFIDGLKGVCEICYTKKHGDNVNHPQHYTQGGIETIDFIKAKLTKEEYIGYLKGNIIKYVTRERHKNGAEDIAKMNWYSNRLDEVYHDKDNR
jgi:hypothetical protein